jgi:succinate dehydrogenase / fumarate reductase cytochrome b subunit
MGSNGEFNEMSNLFRILRSTLGKKYLMAVSGFVLFLFVTGHMLGNLQLFLGPEALNRYAHFLQSLGDVLWVIRLMLLGLVILHIWAALALTIENKSARPMDYSHGQPAYAASLASRTMLIGGGIVALFVVYHILHYTVCVNAVNFTGKDFAHLTDPETGYHDVCAMVIYGFGVWYVSFFYILAVGFLSLHLSHGAAAMFQSLGLRSHAWWPVISKGAKIWAIALFIGYALVPGAILLGYGKDHLKQHETGSSVATTALSQEAR